MGGDPLVEPQPAEQSLGGLAALGFLRFRADGGKLYRLADGRVAAFPQLLVVNVDTLEFVLVLDEAQPVDDRQPARVVHVALAGASFAAAQDGQRLFVHFPADGFAVGVVARRRQHDPDRHLARVARTERHDIPQIAVGLRVQLVENHAAGLVAVLGIGFARQHLELAARNRVVNGLGAVHDAAALHQRGRVLHHPLCRRIHNARVVTVGGDDIDLAVHFPVRV